MSASSPSPDAAPPASPKAGKMTPQKVSRLDFHSCKAAGVPRLGDFQLARPRLESIEKPTKAELIAWAGYAAASVFCLRRTTLKNDGFNPLGLSSLVPARRVAEGTFVVLPEGEREKVRQEAQEFEDARVCCLCVWDKPDGTVGVDVVGTVENWESTQAGRIAKAVADLCRAG